MSFRDETIAAVKAMVGYEHYGGCHAEDCDCESGMEADYGGEYVRRDDVVALLDGMRRGKTTLSERGSIEEQK